MSEIFQKTSSEIFLDLSTSTMMWSFWKTQADHDAALDAVCWRFAWGNLTLNKKFKFNNSSVTLLGFMFSEKEIAPDPKKVDTVTNAPALTTASGIRTYLSMATYCAESIIKFGDVSAPLRAHNQNTQFHWSDKHGSLFKRLRRSL